MTDSAESVSILLRVRPTHVYKHAHRHVHRHVYRHVYRYRVDKDMLWAGAICNSDPVHPAVPAAVKQLGCGSQLLTAIVTGKRV